jgi:hypothetical protein
MSDRGKYVRNGLTSSDVERIRRGVCPSCNGKRGGYSDHEHCDGTVVGHWTCWPCEGTGKPTERDLWLLAEWDKGLCVLCGLPRVIPEGPKRFTDPCVLHLVSYVRALEARLGPPAPEARPVRDLTVDLARLRAALDATQQAVFAGQRRDLIPKCPSGAHFLGNCHCEGT